MKLTVAVAAYGRYRYLDEAADSIARQTRPPDKVLVFTDNREAVRPIFQKHGVEAEILQEPDLIARSEPKAHVRHSRSAGDNYAYIHCEDTRRAGHGYCICHIEHPYGIMSA